MRNALAGRNTPRERWKRRGEEGREWGGGGRVRDSESNRRGVKHRRLISNSPPFTVAVPSINCGEDASGSQKAKLTGI